MLAAIWLYVLCVATFGTYGMVWIYRTARRESAISKPLAVAWGAGLIAAPVAAAVLFQIARDAHLRRGTPAGRATLLIAPVLLIGLSSLLLLPNVKPLWSPFWLIMPLPIVLLDAQLRRISSEATATVGSTTRRVVDVLICVLGLPLAALITWQLEGSTLITLGAQAASAEVESPLGDYRLVLPESGWTSAEVGTVGDADSELEFRSRDQRSFVVIYGHPSATTLDTIVDARRTAVFDVVDGQVFEESRYFSDPLQSLVTSDAKYEVGANALMHGTYRVVTRDLGDRTVEVIAYTSGGEKAQAEIESIVQSLAAAPQEAGDLP